MPAEVENVGRTLGLQGLLAVFLGLIAIVALAHAWRPPCATVAPTCSCFVRSATRPARPASPSVGCRSRTRCSGWWSVCRSASWSVRSPRVRCSNAIGIGTDVVIPWLALGVVAAVGLALTVLVALVPGWRATHVRGRPVD